MRETIMRDWVCRFCGHEVVVSEKPQPINWTDGHVCVLVEVKENQK